MIKDENIIHVIPAKPGYRIVYYDDDGSAIESDDEVIAWRIETVLRNNGNLSYTYPIIIEDCGDSNRLGVLTPDKRLVMYDDAYDSIDAYNEENHKNNLKILADSMNG